jgi:hypothetical protein
MKTNHNLRNIFRVLMIVTTLTMLNISVAQTGYISGASLLSFPDEIYTTGVMKVPTVKSLISSEQSVLFEMDLNPEYWIDYLRHEVITDDELSTEVENTTSKVLQQMEEDPCYWINHLKDETINEDDPSVLDCMEADPYFWPHYLQHTVETDTI